MHRLCQSFALAACSLAAVTLHAQALNSLDSTADITYFDGRPIPANAYRVLFIGDSLTYHTRIPNVWDYVSGMAATSPAKDFVHLTAAHIQAKLPTRPVEILIDNGGNGRIGTMLAYLTAHPELKPSLVVMQGGENDAFDEANRETFHTTYRALLDFFRADHIPYIVLGDWFDSTKSDFDHTEALTRNYAFVPLYPIFTNPAMSGNPGPYNNKGVLRHPNDAGMAAIAAAISTQFDQAVLPHIPRRRP